MTMTMAHRRPLPPPQFHHHNNNENDCDAADTMRVLNDDDNDNDDHHEEEKEEDDDSTRKRRTTTPSYNNTLPNQRKPLSVLLQPVVIMSAAATLSIVALFLLVYLSVRNNKYLTVVFWLRFVVFVPVYLCLYTGVRHTMARMRTFVVLPQRQRQRRSSSSSTPPTPPPPMKKILLPLTLIVTVGSAQLPPYLGAAMAAAAIIAFSIVTRPARLDTTTTTSSSHVPSSSNNNNGNHHQHRSNVTFAMVVRSIITMIAVMLVENFLIWVVSATFVPGQSATTAPPPLQDNGQRVLNYLFHTTWQLPASKSTIVSLRRLLNTQWSLVACVGTSFVVTELYDRRRTLYGIANRALRTVAVARFIRTIAFIMTVVPSQNPNCYRQRGFPVPPPRQWIDWIWIGIIPRSHGGCNDLIVSGHATIISTLACLSTSISDDLTFAIALWSMVVMDFMVEIYEGFHYSVDMWLGIILVTLLWNVLHSCEGLPPESRDVTVSDEASSTHHHHQQQQQQQQEPMTPRSFIAYVIPALVAYLQLIVITQDIANIVIVGFVLSAVFVYVQFASKKTTPTYLRKWYIHYAQHILLCLVFMALGVYL